MKSHPPTLPFASGRFVMGRTLGRYTLIGVLTLVACSFGMGAARADIISDTGSIDLLSSPPASLRLGELTSSADIYVFEERSDVKLPKKVAVDITSAGTYESRDSLTPGLIKKNTLVDSYLLHVDPSGLRESHEYNGSITFNTPILGLVVLSNHLTKTDAFLGAPGTIYPTGQ